MRKYTTLLIILLICLTSFSQNIPSTLEESINYFEKNWNDKEKKVFQSKPENDAVTELHMTVGMWIRNSWLRQGNDSLKKQFHKIGVYHPDDISSIILTSLHRKLNNKEIKLEEQAQHYIDYWKPIIEQNEKSRKIAVEHYNNHKVGDTINIFYPVDRKDNYVNAVIYEYNDEWVFDPKKDLKITGIITKKFYLNSETNVFFELKILKKNFPNIPILMQKMEIGEVYDFNLDKLRIE